MDKHKQQYRKIVDELVNKSFPKLKKMPIFVSNCKYQITGASACVFWFGFFAWIVVLPKSRKHSDKDLKGMLAHELSHIEIILNMGFLEKIKFGFKWLFTKKGKIYFETMADKYAISKGYGKNLFNCYKKIEKGKTKAQLKKARERGYLLSEGTKKYAMKIGKW